MAEKMIRHLLFTYGREVDNPLQGQEDQPDKIIVEGLARLGEVADITREYDLNRGEENGAFFTDEERQEIEDGTYNGVDSPAVYAARLGAEQARITPAEGEGAISPGEMSAEELADYIVEHKLSVQETIALADENDIDSIDKVLDAETLAMQQKNADPRKGVVDALEAKSAQAQTG